VFEVPRSIPMIVGVARESVIDGAPQYTLAKVEPRRTILLLHHDAQLLDLLTRVFEARGFAVHLAATPMQARTMLASDRELDAVVAAWDATHGLGGEVYRWALEHRFELRDRFVFVGEEVPPEFDRIVAGRCLVVRPSDTPEIIRVADATANRSHRARTADPEPQWSEGDRSTLLLADDDPALLAVMADLLGDAGWAVTPVESGNAATAALDTTDFDVILCDWHMANGSGGHVFNWVVTFRPWLLDRIVFLAERPGDGVEKIVQGRPVFAKGSDSTKLLDALRAIAPPRK
jgi:DNA-binding response OmpR family regulator